MVEFEQPLMCLADQKMVAKKRKEAVMVILVVVVIKDLEAIVGDFENVQMSLMDLQTEIGSDQVFEVEADFVLEVQLVN